MVLLGVIFVDPKRIFFLDSGMLFLPGIWKKIILLCFEGQSGILWQLHTQYFETVTVSCSYV